MNGQLTPKQIKKAYYIAAEIVSRFGDPYLPLFKRLHDEVQRINEIQDLKAIAIGVISANNVGEGA